MRRIDKKKAEVNELVDQINYITGQDFKLKRHMQGCGFNVVSESKNLSFTGLYLGASEEEALDKILMFLEGAKASLNYIMFNDLVSVEKTTYLEDFATSHKHRIITQKTKFRKKVVDNRTKEYKRLQKKQMKEERRNKNGT